ncbi:MAG: recombinase family protein [Ruminococcus sp.]|nr:recombinase family protein [Ruminococcus sp.]
MIDDIEDGKITCVITKDLSRLGRNYILTGQYTDIYFPSKGVRYIALSDGVDSEKGESEIALFLNILNEMHARQTSKKVKAAMKTRFLNGAYYSPCAPIGYKWHPEIKSRLIPDEETRWIVEKIFDLAAHGVGAAKICKTLTEEHVPTPAWINYQKYGLYARIIEGQPESRRYAWIVSQVKNLLKNEVYIGNSIHYKQSTISFKNKKMQRKPEEEWLRIEGTHEPIISREVWEQAHAHIDSRKRSSKNGETQIFAGLLKCADCGRTLRYMHNNATATRKEKPASSAQHTVSMARIDARSTTFGMI